VILVDHLAAMTENMKVDQTVAKSVEKLVFEAVDSLVLKMVNAKIE
jgi:hypothetical protein